MPLSRRNFRIALLAFVGASLTLIFLSLERGISHRRWPVKTLADPDRSRVAREKVVDATVADLVSLPRASRPLPRNHRIAPYEMTVYRIRARLIAVHATSTIRPSSGRRVVRGARARGRKPSVSPAAMSHQTTSPVNS